MSTSAKLVAALLLLYFLMTRCQTFDLDRIIPVWKALGWKDVTLVSANGSWPRQGPDLARRASAEGMSLSILVGQDPFHRALREEREARGDLFVRTYFVFADAVDLFPAVRECLLQFRRVYSVMVLALEAGLPEVDELVRSLDFASGFFRATVREDDGAVSLARIQVVKSLMHSSTVKLRNFYLAKWYCLNRPSYEERAMWTTSGSWTAADTATSAHMTCRATWWPPLPSPGSPGWSWTRTARRRRRTVGAGGYW